MADNAAASLSPETQSPLLSLPAELRNRIYAEALRGVGRLNLSYFHRPSLLATCRQIASEALHIYLCENCFEILISDDKIFVPVADTDVFLPSWLKGKETFADQICSLKFEISTTFAHAHISIHAVRGRLNVLFNDFHSQDPCDCGDIFAEDVEKIRRLVNDVVDRRLQQGIPASLGYDDVIQILSIILATLRSEVDSVWA